ncbi:hypothetical protein U9R90_05420 [Streptomyces sp. E11-3]|uniref:hypothetical protein n=1 Tax=Streptomyces sp. E11-3 TaxID=3110112 RepID=UPI00397F85C9
MTTCTHQPSRACYLRGCRQTECKQADYRYMSRIRLDYHRGQRRRQPATQSRAHIQRLLTLGWTQAQIGRASTIGHRAISAILAGQPTVSNHTARSILNIPIGPPPTDTRDVDATGTVRRLQALIAIGWPIAQLADHLGLNRDALGRISRGELQHVRATTADTIALEYRHLARTPGPSTRARNDARRKGWHGPLAWDDHTIDNPATQPDTADPYQPAAKYQRDPYRRDEIEHLHLCGESVPSIAKQLDANEKYIGDQLAAILRELHAGQKRDRKAVAA